MNPSAFSRAFSALHRASSSEDITLTNLTRRSLDLVLQEDDFRFALPLVINSRFSFAQVIECVEDVCKLIDRLELISLLKKMYLDAYMYKKQYSTKHKHCKNTPKINIAKITSINKRFNEEEIFNTNNENNFKYKDKFFYEDCPSDIKGIIEDKKKELISFFEKGSWNDIEIKDRRISSAQCVIEFYILTGECPIEAKYVTNKTVEKKLYFMSPIILLKKALIDKNISNVSRYMSAYPELPYTVRVRHRAFIKEYVMEIKEGLNRTEQKYLRLWYNGFMKENE